MKRFGCLLAILFVAMMRLGMAADLSLSLSDAINIALQRSPDLKSAEARLGMAEGREKEIKSESGLQLTAHGMIMRTTEPTMIPSAAGYDPMVMFMFPDGTQSGGSAAAAFPLFTGGRIPGEVTSAAAGRQAEEFRFREATIQLAYAVKIAYNRVLLAGQEFDAAQDVLTQDEASLQRIKTLYGAGKIPEYNIFRAKAEWAEAKRMTVEAENNVTLRKIDLLRILGLDLNAPLSLTDQMKQSSLSPVKDALIREALAQRPELQAQRKEAASKEARIQAKTGNYYPQVYAYGRLDGLSGNSGQFNGDSVGLVAGLPLFDSGRRTGEVEEAQAELREARFNEQALTLDVSQEVTEACLNFQTAGKLLEEAELGLDSSREDLRVVELRFESGKGIHLEILDAVAAYSRARYRELEALYMVQAAEADLDRAVGKI